MTHLMFFFFVGRFAFDVENNGGMFFSVYDGSMNV